MFLGITVYRTVPCFLVSLPLLLFYWYWNANVACSTTLIYLTLFISGQQFVYPGRWETLKPQLVVCLLIPTNKHTTPMAAMHEWLLEEIMKLATQIEGLSGS